MLAVEQSHQTIFTSQPFDLNTNTTVEAPYPGLDMDAYNSYESMGAFQALPFSYMDSTVMYQPVPAQPVKHEMLRSTSANSNIQYSQHQHELPPALISSGSGPSIPSASSSTVGSPYSGPSHTVMSQDSYGNDASYGLGLYPAIVNHEGYSHEFMGAALDHDLPLGSDKLTGNYVGESADLSSSVSRSSTILHQPLPLSSTASLSTSSPEILHINTTLEHATPNSAIAQLSGATSSEVSTVTVAHPTTSLFKSPTTPASANPRTPNSQSPVDVRALSSLSVSSRSPLTKSLQSHGVLPMPHHNNRFQSHFFAQSSDPSLIQSAQFSDINYAEQPFYPQHIQQYSVSPAPSPSPSTHQYPLYTRTQFSPPVTHDNYQQQQPAQQQFLSRRPSIASYISGASHASPSSDEEGKEKGRCLECGKVFKDLKAHMLTHQPERPEKCPIITCEYHQKGFARKYDKNRHTLTHYKGNMVCGFCPGSGSAAEKSFNRADVFKRHLTSVHGVEQAPPNSRKRSPTASTRRLSSYCQDATGKCSTCSATFNNAQDFYEHLDDCVLRVVQQEEPSEAINAQHLQSMASDNQTQDTLDRHMIKSEDLNTSVFEDDDDEEESDEDDDEDEFNFNDRSGKGTIKTNKTAGSSRAVLSGGITKSNKSTKKGMTWSKGGVALVGKGRKKRKHYPPSWGMSAEKMQMKKRVLCVYDGERRLWKDDMMLHNEFEVRMKLPDGNSYVTDLDVETLKRAEAFHNATDAEKGPWPMTMEENMDGFALNELMAI